MSETTIRVDSCRGDGRCPECGGLYDSTLMHSHDLPCGCVAVGMSCAERHLRALLTEALRQLSAALTAADQSGWAAMRRDAEDASALLREMRDERDAAIRRLKALDLCTVCAGTGKPVSGKPCICGGHGGIGNQIIGLTREAQRAHEKAAQFEADWMEAKYEFGVTLTKERERAEKSEALLRKCLPRIVEPGSDLRDEIREALPK